MNGRTYATILVLTLIPLTVGAEEFPRSERFRNSDHIDLELPSPTSRIPSFSNTLDLYTMDLGLDRDIEFVGFHHYWVKALRSEFRRRLREDILVRESEEAPHVVAKELDDMVVAESFRRASRKPPRRVGRTEDFFSAGPIRLTSRLRLRVNLRITEILFPTDRIGRGGQRLHSREPIFSQTRLGLRASVGLKGLKKVGVKLSGVVKLGRLKLGTSVAGRYLVRRREWRVVFAIAPVRF